MVMEPETDIPSLPIRIDKEGVWYYNGAVMFRKDILKLFFKSLKMDDLGRYLIEFEGDKWLIEVEDTPFIVKTVSRFNKDDSENESIEILLSDSTSEMLNLSTVRVGMDNVLYCSIKNKKFEARFSRSGYYQIAEFIKYDEDKGSYFLPLNGRMYYIKDDHSGSGPGVEV